MSGVRRARVRIGTNSRQRWGSGGPASRTLSTRFFCCSKARSILWEWLVPATCSPFTTPSLARRTERYLCWEQCTQCCSTAASSCSWHHKTTSSWRLPVSAAWQRCSSVPFIICSKQPSSFLSSSIKLPKIYANPIKSCLKIRNNWNLRRISFKSKIPYRKTVKFRKI